MYTGEFDISQPITPAMLQSMIKGKDMVACCRMTIIEIRESIHNELSDPLQETFTISRHQPNEKEENMK